MVAVLILHGRSDLDWAVALANELAEHAPVRFQIGVAPPKVKLGPSVVRIGLWSAEAAGEGLSHTMAHVLGAEPTHGVLVRRGDCPPPGELDTARLAQSIGVAGAREAAQRLRDAIPTVAATVTEIAATARNQVEDARERRRALADNALLALVLLGVGAAALRFNWWGLGTWVAGLFS
jgi:hypothetical protein